MVSSGSATDWGEGMPWSLTGDMFEGGSDSVESSGGVAIASATSSIRHEKEPTGGASTFT